MFAGLAHLAEVEDEPGREDGHEATVMMERLNSQYSICGEKMEGRVGGGLTLGLCSCLSTNILGAAYI